ncbi:MAG: DUF2612 domain-containing protein [Gemmatimonadota bacterium]|nr:DUF2612 domain-containing protein [Gemmatimonadota bacterium]
MTSFPTVELSARIGLILPQYENSEKLKGLISGVTTILEEQVTNPLQRLDRFPNPDACSGVLLDWIGKCIGLLRPVIPSGEYLGVLGTEPSGGEVLEDAPTYDPARAVSEVAPLGDDIFRLLLKARARRLRGGANRETIEAVLAILWSDGDGYVDEAAAVSSGDPVVLVVTADDDILFRLVDVPVSVNSVTVHNLIIPRPAGVRIAFRRITPTAGDLLTESGDALLTESGDNLVLDN